MILLALHCLFTPPQNWEIADPKTPSKEAIIGFVDKRKAGFCPSVHLTRETIDLPIEKYLAIVQKNLMRKKMQWKSLGTVETQSGPAYLAQIETETKFGPARLLQAILVKDKAAFILTVGATKKEFPKRAAEFEALLRSMKLCDSLLDYIEDPKEKRAFLEAWQKKEQDVESFRKSLIEHATLGPVWQLLVSLNKPEMKE